MKLSKILKEIQIRPQRNWEKEYYIIYDEVCNEYDVSKRDISRETDNFLNYEGDIDFTTNSIFKEKFGFDYWEWEEKNKNK